MGTLYGRELCKRASGTLTNVCYIGTVILLIVIGIVFGGYIEARKREKKYDSVTGRTDLIKPDEG